MMALERQLTGIQSSDRWSLKYSGPKENKGFDHITTTEKWELWWDTKINNPFIFHKCDDGKDLGMWRYMDIGKGTGSKIIRCEKCAEECPENFFHLARMINL